MTGAAPGRGIRSRMDTLFVRLFGMFLGAILLAHLLGYLWLEHYGHPHPGPPPGPPGWSGPGLFPGPPPPPPSDGPPPGLLFWPGGPAGPPPGPEPGGPWVPLGLQLLALIVAAWCGARLLTRPIRQLSAAAERLSDNLDSPPLAEKGPVEVVQAARTFNLMQQRIREQVEQRGRILTAVSHDLRTPLARLRLRVEQVEDLELRQRLSQDLWEMTGMLETTLSYVREQKAREQPYLFDVQALAESMAENARDCGEDVRVEGQCRPLRTSPMALRSCLGNLLGNALRYAGHACICLGDSPEQLTIRVVDHGPGIPASQREAVLEPFFRLEGSRNRDSGGTGLGLTITRDAVQRLGGTLQLTETPGGGLTVVLVLPRH